jgi:hypothetical protein
MLKQTHHHLIAWYCWLKDGIKPYSETMITNVLRPEMKEEKIWFRKTTHIRCKRIKIDYKGFTFNAFEISTLREFVLNLQGCGNYPLVTCESLRRDSGTVLGLIEGPQGQPTSKFICCYLFFPQIAQFFKMTLLKVVLSNPKSVILSFQILNQIGKFKSIIQLLDFKMVYLLLI